MSNQQNNELENELYAFMHELLKELPEDQRHLIVKQVDELKNSMQQNLITPLLTVIEEQTNSNSNNKK